MNSTRPGRRALRAGSSIVAALVLGGTLLGGVSPAMAAFHSPGDFNRAQVALRANAWVKDGIYYSQTSWYNGYRQDCSGFVSMAWGLGKSYVTWTLPEVAWPIHKSDLAMGDIMLNVDDHVVIFDRWANASHTAYWDWELAGSTNRPVHRVVPYPFWTSDRDKYKPYRFAVSPRYTGKRPAAPSAPKMLSTATTPSVPATSAPQKNAARKAESPARLHDRKPATRAPAAAQTKRARPDGAPHAPLPTRVISKHALVDDDRPPAPEKTLLVLLKSLVSWLAD